MKRFDDTHFRICPPAAATLPEEWQVHVENETRLAFLQFTEFVLTIRINFDGEPLVPRDRREWKKAEFLEEFVFMPETQCIKFHPDYRNNVDKRRPAVYAQAHINWRSLPDDPIWLPGCGPAYCHRCDDPGCIAPYHGRYDTELSNRLDSLIRSPGTQNGRHKNSAYTDREILLIRDDPRTAKEIVAAYGYRTTEQSIYKIKRRESHCHVDIPKDFGIIKGKFPIEQLVIPERLLAKISARGLSFRERRAMAIFCEKGTAAQLAVKFGVTPATIYNAKSRRCFTELLQFVEYARRHWCC